jgi:hypothetical protein
MAWAIILLALSFQPQLCWAQLPADKSSTGSNTKMKTTSADPASLGELKSFQEMAPQLVSFLNNSLTKDKYPASFTEFVDAQVKDFKRSDKQNKILVLPAGTHLDATLKLDWDTDWVKDKGIVAVYCPGDLTVDGDLLNRNINSGPLLVVGGNLKVDNLVSGGARFLIVGNVNASGLAIGDYNDGVCRVGGDLTAKTLILLDHDFGIYGKTHAHTVDWNEDSLPDVLVKEVFSDNDPEEVSVDKLLKRQHSGLAILRAETK